MFPSDGDIRGSYACKGAVILVFMARAVNRDGTRIDPALLKGKRVGLVILIVFYVIAWQSLKMMLTGIMQGLH